MRRKEERSKQGTIKAKQHSTPKAVTFPKKNELPRVGLEPTTLMYICITISSLDFVLGSTIVSNHTVNYDLPPIVSWLVAI